jgi:type I restriction enzyme S subunit
VGESASRRIGESVNQQIGESANQRVSESANQRDGAWTLPDGWVWTTIGEITQPIEKVKPRENPATPFTYLDISSIDNKTHKIAEPKTYYGAEAPSRARQLVEANDVLFSTVRTYLKNIALVPEIYNGQIASTGFSVIRAESEVSSKYLFYYSLTDQFVSELGKLQRGTSYPAVRDGDVRVQPIPLAPLPEQRRIVDEIETQFTRLEAGMAALERAQANLRRYKASVLKAACEGRLVPTEAESARAEGRDYEPADQLLARILAERRARWEAENPGKKYKEPAPPDTEGLSELPEGWTVASMGQLATLITSGPRHWSKYYDKGDGVFLMAQNVRPGKLDLSYRKLIDPPEGDSSKERSQVSKGDLLVTIVGANTGDVCQVPRELPNHYICQSVALMRPVDPIFSDFLTLYLTSPENGQRQYRRYIYGAGRPHLKFDELRMTAIMLPPLAEQRRIVAEVERRLSVVAALEREVEAALARAGRLRQSVLKRAFEGRLVPQDPSDELASVLLERIRAQRETPKRGKRQKSAEQLRLPGT